MKSAILGVSVIALLAAGPAWAQDKGQDDDGYGRATANEKAKPITPKEDGYQTARPDLYPIPANEAATGVGTSGQDTQNGVEKAATKTKKGAKKVARKTKDGAEVVGQETKEGAGKVVDKTKAGLGKAGSEITDGYIITRVKSRFVNEDALKGSNINVDSDGKVVTLRGTVASEAGRARAIAVAKGTEGVKSVNDQLTIGPKQ
jgi:osmotically-inducible protein OsmY